MTQNDDKYALSESWAHGNEYKKPFDYTVKGSGQTVLLRRLDMGDLLKLGIAEQMDLMSKSLMAEEKEQQTEQDAKQAVSDAILKADNFESMERMVNEVCLAGIIKPKLQRVPEHEAARQPGQMYIDSVPFEDRMELFSVIYDAEGLSVFREEQANGVGDVANVQSVQLPPDRSVDIRSDDTEGVLLQSGSVPVGIDGGLGNEQSGEPLPAEQETGPVDGRIGSHGEAGSSEQVPESRIEAIP
jgi:hypothetical protein